MQKTQNKKLYFDWKALLKKPAYKILLVTIALGSIAILLMLFSRDATRQAIYTSIVSTFLMITFVVGLTQKPTRRGVLFILLSLVLAGISIYLAFQKVPYVQQIISIEQQIIQTEDERVLLHGEEIDEYYRLQGIITDLENQHKAANNMRILIDFTSKAALAVAIILTSIALIDNVNKPKYDYDSYDYN